MSSRAALIARALGATLLFAWLAATEPRLMVVLAFALPFWIASEIETRVRRTKVTPARDGSLLHLRPIAARASDGPSHRTPHKAA